ncbi:hypothetical protein A2886_01640 [candidate division WWE3 bacterium RIFCSPHIGHO2_01_FULL_42_13]|uniref:Gas vesicle protein n=1 Tax=candidate division WWE3 bacterium RIFCSPHIGHO2_01_FULL_42_13 TaxID=1802617 RepID=A0A1F4UT12_UNCKA|nr:MAG: hypothetical protein A2886_01640 [candidate division WWE3 bacterium RIFCSPHIGHO2_01_FULL_42_13]
MPHNHYCEHCNHSKSGGFTNGLLIGALVGAALGLLYAPATGDKTRKKVKKAAAELSERGQKAWEDVSDLAEDAGSAAEPLLKELEKNVAPVLRKARASGRHVQNEVMERIERLIDEASGN